MGEAPSCYLNTRQAAALLGLSYRTLESYRVKGGGPPFLTYCNRIHYLRSDLDRWTAEGRKRSTSDGGGAEDGRGRAVSPRRGDPEATDAASAAGTGGHLSVKELAALLKVSQRTLARYRGRGKGPGFEKVSGQVRYPRAGVEAWLESCRLSPASGPVTAVPDMSPASPENA